MTPTNMNAAHDFLSPETFAPRSNPHPLELPAGYSRPADRTPTERDLRELLARLEALARDAPVTRSARKPEAWATLVTRLQDAARDLLPWTRGRPGASGQSEVDVPTAAEVADPSEPDPAAARVTGPGVERPPRTEPATPTSAEQCTYVRQHDYWTVAYGDQTACLKSTRGLECLSCLLRSPGREFHVSELLASLTDAPLASEAPSVGGGGPGNDLGFASTGLNDGCPLLDAQAKAEYRTRLNELREELAEAEQFNDPDRASRVRDEVDALAQHIAAAVGLGARDRKTSSDAERARSAVTKRIKNAIGRIAEAIPALGDHLGTRIKTGYYCSYRPPAEGSVSWRF